MGRRKLLRVLISKSSHWFRITIYYTPEAEMTTVPFSEDRNSTFMKLNIFCRVPRISIEVKFDA